MSFVFKEERKFGLRMSQTDKTVGPGTYAGGESLVGAKKRISV